MDCTLKHLNPEHFHGGDAVWSFLCDAYQPLFSFWKLTLKDSFSASGILQEQLPRLLDRPLTHFELPIIKSAFELAQSGDWTALVELDRTAEQSYEDHSIRKISLMVGQSHLKWLANLKGQTPLKAFNKSHQFEGARGFHPIVYGLHAYVFSLPLREALVTYSWRAMENVVFSGARNLQIKDEELQNILSQISTQLRARVNWALDIPQHAIGKVQYPSVAAPQARIQAQLRMS